MRKTLTLLPHAGAVALLFTGALAAQPKGFNYDESKVPEYTLPDPLVLANGEPVKDARTWNNHRRPEILELFTTQVYGRSPGRPAGMTFKEFDRDEKALDGKAIRKQITVHFSGDEKGPSMDILVYLPRSQMGPVPIFVGLNFGGNQTVQLDPGIKLSPQWVRNRPESGVVNNRANESSRGAAASRWPVEMILAHGYGLATIYCGDLDPDFEDEFKNGVHSLSYKDGQSKPEPDEWGSIAAWAWGLSRAVDYFETDAEIDHERVSLLGHSRLGKTALWAGARDTRFALVISNESGCGGAALSRRRFGETVQRINTSFPHWFCDNFQKYNEKEAALPLDQHMLIALIAPRPIYVASAEGDQWSDPRGEFLGAKHADPVYRLLGTAGLGAERMPAVNQPVGETIRYHNRTGKHDVTGFDWEQYLRFADKHLRAGSK
jgi:hypothetical protein